jgi:hypothetical protein
MSNAAFSFSRCPASVHVSLLTLCILQGLVHCQRCGYALYDSMIPTISLVIVHARAASICVAPCLPRGALAHNGVTLRGDERLLPGALDGSVSSVELTEAVCSATSTAPPKVRGASRVTSPFPLNT